MPFGIYIHIPYCITKCPYCDFNSYGVGVRFPEEEYTDSVLRELEFYKDDLNGKEITSIFFGGGTPSLFNPSSIERIISRIYETAKPSEEIEISLEVNPKTADLEKLRGLRTAGVKRISVGVQSFSERKLKFLGRINSPDDSRRILQDIVKAGFENYSMDLMYGTRDETFIEWRNDLREAISYGYPHISAYCLTIEDGTEFGRRYAEGSLKVPPDETLTEFITFTTDFLEHAGYNQYEISNYAKSGAECSHNMLYWRGDSYVGLGAGAHSHFAKSLPPVRGMRWANLRNPAQYMKSIGEARRPVDFSETLNSEEAVQDKVLMGLRLKEGINISELESSFNLNADMRKINKLVEEGFLENMESTYRLTKKGTLLSNAVILKFVEALV